jgi:DNA-binding PadR family transcriptional regulator
VSFPADDLTQRQLIVLRIVWSHGPASGTELLEPANEALDIERQGHGTLYENLATLIELGYVEKRKIDGRTNEYACTHEGAKLLWDVSAWMIDDR